MIGAFNEQPSIHGVSNSVLIRSGYHLSYDSNTSDYGSDTTAIVLKGRVFFILNGDHRKELALISDESGETGCIDYFLENIQLANGKSEHHYINGDKADVFGLRPTVLEILGEKYLKLIENIGK